MNEEKPCILTSAKKKITSLTLVLKLINKISKLNGFL